MEGREEATSWSDRCKVLGREGAGLVCVSGIHDSSSALDLPLLSDPQTS